MGEGITPSGRIFPENITDESVIFASEQLAATEIEKRTETKIPDLNMAGIQEFLKERVTVWMKDACAVLKQYITAVQTPSTPSDVGGKQGEQLSLGDALA